MLKDLREERHLTQKELAEASGVSLRAIQSYEQGWRSLQNVPYATVTALAEALKIDPKKLIE